MASLQDIMGMYQSFDPYGQFRAGQDQPVKADIRTAMLQDTAKEMQDERQQAEKGAQTGQPLQGMANQLLPGAKLTGSDGMPTVAGQMNDMLVNAQKLAKQGQTMIRQAALVDDPVQQSQIMAEGRRMIQNAQQDSQKAQQLHQNTINDSIYAAATAQNPQEWNNALKAYQESGLPLPQGIPLDYSPENVKKIAALAPAALQSKINNDIIKRDREAEESSLRKMKLRKEIAKEQGNLDGGASGPLESKSQIDSFINKVNAKSNKADKIPTGVGRTVLEQIAPEYRSDLDTSKGIKDVGNKISVARGAYEISDFIREKGIKTGKVGEIKKAIDSLGLKDPDAELDPNVIYKAINNQELAKKVIDFANAYARAESGRNIATVAEFKTAMKTFGEASMSGKSAEYVFKNIGDQKVKQIENDYFGGNKAVTVKGYEPKKPQTVTVGDQTYTRPAGMSDKDWSQYQKDVGAKSTEAKK